MLKNLKKVAKAICQLHLNRVALQSHIDDHNFNFLIESPET